jgi:Na+/phosphate symporter
MLMNLKERIHNTITGDDDIDDIIGNAIHETLKEVESLKLSDEFAEWHKDILGTSDELGQIIDKIVEKLKETMKK